MKQLLCISTGHGLAGDAKAENGNPARAKKRLAAMRMFFWVFMGVVELGVGRKTAARDYEKPESSGNNSLPEIQTSPAVATRMPAIYFPVGDR